MNLVRAEIESVNYDYLPGEPDSRRTLYVTLRAQPLNIRIGSYVKIVSSGVTFQVEDVSGRNVISRSSNSTGIRRMGVDLYSHRPLPYNIYPDYLEYNTTSPYIEYRKYD